MDKTLKVLLATSVAVNVTAILAYVGATTELKKVKENRQKIHNYATVLHDLVKTHYDNGGELRMTKEMSIKIDAYTILADNDMG